MMDTLKKRLGRRIREAREKSSLSREQLCRDESQLTVRQLARIELGQSLPSIVKLKYISDILEMDMVDLLEGDNLTIPESYFELKYKLLKFPSYGDSERMQQKSELITSIYDTYLDILPEDELFTLELLENIQEHRITGNSVEAEVIFEDYFSQLLTKQHYQLNDLLLSSYYLMQSGQNSKKQADTKLIIDTILAQPLKASDEYSFALLGAMSSVAVHYVLMEKFEDIGNLTEKMNTIIDWTGQHSLKPVVLMLEAKYHLKVFQDKLKAEELYKLGIFLAKTFGEQVLEKKISQEMKNDLTT